ncbi:hypothetical protein Tco_0293959 [Tanacetum coccineum]
MDLRINSLENVIGESRQTVSIRDYNHEQAYCILLMAFLTSVKPKKLPRCINSSMLDWKLCRGNYEFEQNGFESVNPVDIPWWRNPKRDEDKEESLCRTRHTSGMWNLLYLQASRLTYNLLYDVWPGYQARPTEQDLNAAFAMRIHDGCQVTPPLAHPGPLDLRSQTYDYGFGFNKIPMHCGYAKFYAARLLNKLVDVVEEKKVNEEIRKGRWWEIIRRRPTAATKDHMISSYDVLIIQFDESNANVLERFYTSAGNPVKEILLKLNLPDHRILKDGGEAFQVNKTKNGRRHVGQKSQDNKMTNVSQMAKRDYVCDDLTS